MSYLPGHGIGNLQWKLIARYTAQIAALRHCLLLTGHPPIEKKISLQRYPVWYTTYIVIHR